MLVQNILKSKSDDTVITVKAGSLMSEAIKVLSQRKIGTVLVSKDGHTAEGILSERDIVRALFQHGGKILSKTVDAYMTKKLVTCIRDDSADKVLNLMTAGRFRHMPVVENDKIVEFISISDLVLAHLNEVEFENDALKGSVTGNVRRKSN